MLYSRGILVALLIAGPFLAGCSSNNKGKIEGTKWISEATTIKVKDKDKDKDENIPAGAGELEFRSDGGLTYKIDKKSKEDKLETKTAQGTYSLGIGDTVMFNFNKELEGRKTHSETIVIVGDQLKLTDSDGTTIPFKRLAK